MSLFNTSKIVFVVFFGISAMNTQVFAAEVQQPQPQERGFFRKLQVAAIAALITVGFTVSPIMADPLVCGRTLTMADAVCAGLNCPRAERERAEAQAKLCAPYYKARDLEEDPFNI